MMCTFPYKSPNVKASQGESSYDPTADTFYFRLHRTSENPSFMPVQHQHNTIEINLLDTGKVTYLMAGQLLSLPVRKLCAFWGAVPHHVVGYEQGTCFYCIHVPMAWFLTYGLPEEFTHNVLAGEFIIEPDERRSAHDLLMFQDWENDFGMTPNPSIRRVQHMELQSRLHRLAERVALSTLKTPELHVARRMRQEFSKVEDMARFIAENYPEPITAVEVARHVGLHPKHASQVFHRKCGIGLKQYITLNRIRHAQFLLITTSGNILDIAMLSGFGSASRFYAAFQDLCGMPPSSYRDTLGGPHPPEVSAPCGVIGGMG